jgi:hypothetical protein
LGFGVALRCMFRRRGSGVGVWDWFGGKARHCPCCGLTYHPTDPPFPLEKPAAVLGPALRGGRGGEARQGGGQGAGHGEGRHQGGLRPLRCVLCDGLTGVDGRPLVDGLMGPCVFVHCPRAVLSCSKHSSTPPTHPCEHDTHTQTRRREPQREVDQGGAGAGARRLARGAWHVCTIYIIYAMYVYMCGFV